MTMLHGYMQTYSSLFSDTKKTTITIAKTEKKQKTTTFTQIGSNITWEILSLCGLNPPPPTQCISDPLLLFSTFTLMVIPIYLNFFLPNKRHMRKQTLTKLVLSGLYRPKLWRTIIQLLLQKTCSWMLLPLSSSLSTPQSLYK